MTKNLTRDTHALMCCRVSASLPAGYIGMLNKGCVERLWSRLYPSQPHISGTVLVNTDLDSFPF